MSEPGRRGVPGPGRASDLEVSDLEVSDLEMRSSVGTRVVALGGGHGLAASLAALRLLPAAASGSGTASITAVVTVADDGGSSGRLRTELGMLPPGDLRMALAALIREGADSELRSAVLQHRFGGSGSLGGHPVGNVLLAGLFELVGNPVDALDTLGRLFGVCGRVLPVSPEPMDIVADVVGVDPADPHRVTRVRGQVAVATTPGQVIAVQPIPHRPTACPEAVAAIRAADFVILGPGSWFSSVLPHLVVPDILTALSTTPARRILVLNLAAQAGETSGFSPETHLEVLAAHAPALTVDIVLADPATVADVQALERAAAALGARLMLAPVGVPDGSPRHDPELLAAAYSRVFTQQVAPERVIEEEALSGKRAEPVGSSEGAG